MRDTGLSQAWPSMPSIIAAWLTPRPSRKRPPESSASSRWAAAAMPGSRLKVTATPVATTRRSVASSSGRRGDRLPADRLGDPQRTVAQLFELRGRRARPRRRLEVELGGPDPHAPRPWAPTLPCAVDGTVAGARSATLAARRRGRRLRVGVVDPRDAGLPAVPEPGAARHRLPRLRRAPGHARPVEGPRRAGAGPQPAPPGVPRGPGGGAGGGRLLPLVGRPAGAPAVPRGRRWGRWRCWPPSRSPATCRSPARVPRLRLGSGRIAVGRHRIVDPLAGSAAGVPRPPVRRGGRPDRGPSTAAVLGPDEALAHSSVEQLQQRRIEAVDVEQPAGRPGRGGRAGSR